MYILVKDWIHEGLELLLVQNTILVLVRDLDTK